MVQVAVVKDKQIDLLSSMLAQKEVEIKNLTIEHNNHLREVTQKMVDQLNMKELENQNQ